MEFKNNRENKGNVSVLKRFFFLYTGPRSKSFRSCDLDAPFLLPPSPRDWLPENHLAHFIAEIADGLDLSKIFHSYGRRDGRGKAAYHPVMLVRLLLYGYCVGVMSSRRIERATYEDLAFRYLSVDQHPDHATLASFRQQHLAVLAELFTQVLQLCDKAGLVKLGHVAIDGTKLQANAGKHKAMSYERMEEKEKQLKAEVEKLMAEEAAATDAVEDALHGKGNRGDELPEELARRESRLKKIAEAKASLEQEARERAEAAKKAAEEKLEQRRKQEEESGKKAGGRPPQVPDPEQAKPEPKAQRNYTEPQNRRFDSSPVDSRSPSAQKTCGGISTEMDLCKKPTASVFISTHS
ncbi:MAG: transposase [Bryobacterales bacterium]|nr:transposase [Bryobacterales bacterium]